MAFCSYNIFLKIAASFSMVALVDSPVHLLLKVFEKRPYRSWAYLWGTFLRYFPWGLFSLPIRIGVLVPEPCPNPPEKGTGDTRGLLLSRISSSLKTPLLPALLDASQFCWKKKEQLISKLLTHLIRTKYKKKSEIVKVFAEYALLNEWLLHKISSRDCGK